MTDQPLFDLPDQERPPVPVKRTPTGKATWTHCRLKVRTLCDDCVQLIHELGVVVAPHPQPVRWRRSTPNTINLYCEAHARIRKESEPVDQSHRR